MIHTNTIIVIIVYTFMYTYVTLMNEIHQCIHDPLILLNSEAFGSELLVFMS